MLSQNLPVAMLSELQYADDLVLMSEKIEGFINKFLKWNKAFESKGLKVNLRNTKVMVTGGIQKNGLPKSKVDPHGVSRLIAKANSICVYSVVSGSTVDVPE